MSNSSSPIGWHYSVGYIARKKAKFQSDTEGINYHYDLPPVCEARDLSCFFQPLPCAPQDGFEAYAAAVKGLPPSDAAAETRRRVLVPHPWLAKEVKRRVDLVPVNDNQCAILHVRRSDTQLNRGRQATADRKVLYKVIKVSDFLNAAQPHLQKRPEVSTIFMITDDQTVVDELSELTPNDLHGRRFVYLDRKRFRGTEGGWENHFPSGR